ncbi:MAG: A24 family peptidase C-terminal domain-containing protein [archaeon]
MHPVIFVPFLVFFGLLTSFEDFRRGIIRNKWIVIALAYSLVTTLVTGSSLLVYAINLLMSFFYGFIIWIAGLWSAGDAKLFLAYSALIPGTVYIHGIHSPYLTAFTLLVNTFVPLFFYYLFRIIIKTGIRHQLNAVKMILSPSLMLGMAVFLFGFSWIIGGIFALMDIPFDFFVMVVILFVILFILEKFSIKISLVGILVSVLALTLGHDETLTMPYIRSFLTILVLFLVMRYYVLTLSYDALTSEIYIENLKPGMHLAENILDDHDILRKRSGISYSFIQSLFQQASPRLVFGATTEGLTKKQITEIIDLHNQGRLPDHTIRIFHTLPFAPFMLLGAALTLLCQGDFLICIRLYILPLI